MAKIKVQDKITIFDNYKREPYHQFRIPGFWVTIDFLNDNPNVFFVFGDNLVHRGKGGAASLRDLSNTIGFITKKYPNNDINSFFKPDEYYPIFNQECAKMCDLMSRYQNHYYLFSKLGAGLANKFCIFEKLIEPWLLSLETKFVNCALLF